MSAHHESHPDYPSMGIFAGYGEYEDLPKEAQAMNEADKRLEAAQARYDEVKHGKDAFLGSSAWGDYQHARRELEAARAAVIAQRDD